MVGVCGLPIAESPIVKFSDVLSEGLGLELTDDSGALVITQATAEEPCDGLVIHVVVTGSYPPSVGGQSVLYCRSNDTPPVCRGLFGLPLTL